MQPELTNPYARAYLQKHGYDTPDQIQRLLDFQEGELRDIRRMESGPEILARLEAAVRGEERIVIYGDYDADGIMAAFTLFAGLDTLCPDRVRIFINDRFEDGYSMSACGVDKLLERYPDTELIISCDNGVNAADAVKRAGERGVDVLITDHHVQTTPLPEKTLVLDEKSERQLHADAAAGIAREDFCGAELARRVITALYEEMDLAEEQTELLDGLYGYAGFATLTDSVPLRPENHFVARRGLMQMRGEGLLWRILREECRLMRPVDGETVGFVFGPMINAGSRVTGSAVPALKVLYAAYKGNENACRSAIRELLSYNETRKRMAREEEERAFAVIRERGYANDPFIFLYDESFSEGINGLTAARITESFHVPTAVLCPTRTEEGYYKGSARSVAWFDLAREMASHPEIMKAGGHPMAAGLRVRAEDLEEARRLLIEDANRARIDAPEEETGEADVDFVFAPEDLSIDLIGQLQEAWTLLEPFGPEFPPPAIALSFTADRLIGLRGKDGTECHAKITVQGSAKDGSLVEVLWWNRLEEARGLYMGTIDLVAFGRPELNTFQGATSIQFVADKMVEGQKTSGT